MRNKDTNAFLWRLLLSGGFLFHSAFLMRTLNSSGVETPGIAAGAHRRSSSSKMMRVGRRHVARVWTCVDAPATASSVAVGRGVGSCCVF